jgi:hypothetical protein
VFLVARLAAEVDRVVQRLVAPEQQAAEVELVAQRQRVPAVAEPEVAALKRSLFPVSDRYSQGRP